MSNPVTNTDIVLWRAAHGDYSAPSISVTRDGGGIGINVGGCCVVMPIHDWHRLAMAAVDGGAMTPSPTNVVRAPQAMSDSTAKLYCPAHGKISTILGDTPIYLMGARYCPHCLANALERIGAHQLVEKAPTLVKKW